MPIKGKNEGESLMLQIKEENLEKFLEKEKGHLFFDIIIKGGGNLLAGISIIIGIIFMNYKELALYQKIFYLFSLFIAIIVSFTGIIQIIRSIKNKMTPERLFQEIKELDENTFHNFNIILIKNGEKKGQYLLFKSNRWSCKLFPNYRCLKNEDIDLQKEIPNIKRLLKLDFGKNFNFIIKYFGKIQSTKYSVGDRVNKKYNFFFYEVTSSKFIKEFGSKNFTSNGKKFYWMTLDKIQNDKNIIKKNSDVLDFIRNNFTVS